MKNAGKVILMVLGVGTMAVTGCDPSKAELDKTKATLASVTTERDVAKAQLVEANQKNAALSQQLTELQAKAAAAAPPAAAAAPAAAEPAAHKKPTKAHAAGVPAAAPPPSPEVQKQIKEIDQKANTARGRF